MYLLVNCVMYVVRYGNLPRNGHVRFLFCRPSDKTHLLVLDTTPYTVADGCQLWLACAVCIGTQAPTRLRWHPQCIVSQAFLQVRFVTLLFCLVCVTYSLYKPKPCRVTLLSLVGRPVVQAASILHTIYTVVGKFCQTHDIVQFT